MKNSAVTTVKGAAAILGVHPWTVRAWSSSNRIPSHRSPGGHRLFFVSDLLDYRYRLNAAVRAGAALGKAAFLLAQGGGGR